MTSEIFSGLISLAFSGQCHLAFNRPNAISATILALDGLQLKHSGQQIMVNEKDTALTTSSTKNTGTWYIYSIYRSCMSL